MGEVGGGGGGGKRERVKNGSEVPREMGINERAINRVNGRRHAILRHFIRRRVVDRLTDTRLLSSGAPTKLHRSPYQSCSRRSARRSYFVRCKKRGMNIRRNSLVDVPWLMFRFISSKNFLSTRSALPKKNRNFILILSFL